MPQTRRPHELWSVHRVSKPKGRILTALVVNSKCKKLLILCQAKRSPRRQTEPLRPPLKSEGVFTCYLPPFPPLTSPASLPPRIISSYRPAYPPRASSRIRSSAIMTGAVGVSPAERRWPRRLACPCITYGRGSASLLAMGSSRLRSAGWV